jgi:hypothetical protein
MQRSLVAVSGFDPPHTDVLSRVCNAAGVDDIQESVSACSKLHQAWQEAVKAVKTRASVLTDSDVELLKKYKQLQRLTMIRSSEEEEKGSISPEVIPSSLSNLLDVRV